MAGPFYIYIHGQWAEIDIETGKVYGNGNTKFLYVKNGKLVVAKTSHVLASLRALATGQRSAVRLGATLSARRRRSFKKERRRRLYEPCMRSHCCNAGHHGCSQQQPIIVTQQVLTNTVSNEPTQFTEQVLNNKVLNEQNLNNNNSNEHHPNKVLNKPSSHKPVHNLKRNAVIRNDSNTANIKPIEINTSNRESPCKELFIDYNDVEYIKKFLRQNPQHCGSFKPDLFEEDPGYRNSVLFMFNPLVKIDKSKKIEKLLVEDQDNMTLKEFAATLGLTHIDDKKDKHAYKTRQNKEKSRNNFLDKRLEEKENFKDFYDRKKHKTIISDTDSSDETLGQINNRMNNGKEIKMNVLSSRCNNEEKERKRLRPAKPIYTKMSAAREYSNLEDHAIISWLSVGDRSRKVNGNRLWRELQAQYHNITSVSRSWHSLRNRYLRYILPSLGHLMLEPAQQARLRAGAARGELKLTRKKSLNRRNSIFENKKVDSASARRPKDTLDQKNEDQNKKNEDQTKKVPDKTKKVSEEQAKKSLEDQVKKNIERLLSKPVVVVEKGPQDKLETPVEKSSSRRSVLSLRRSGHSVSVSGHSQAKSRLSEDKLMALEFENAAPALPARRRSPPSYESLTKDFVRTRRRRLSTETKSTPSPQPRAPPEPETKKRRLFNPRAVWSPITKSVEIVSEP